MQATASELRDVLILVVEDNPDVLEATAYLIEAAFGYSVLTASSCVEALEIIDGGHRIDLLFSDVILPGKDGLALARLARQRMPELPVALVTGWHDEIDSIVDRGYVALLKPYSVERLTAVFAELLCAPGRVKENQAPSIVAHTTQSPRGTPSWRANPK